MLSLSPKKLLCLLALVTLLPACGKSSASGGSGMAVSSSVATPVSSSYNFSSCIMNSGTLLNNSTICAIPRMIGNDTFYGSAPLESYQLALGNINAGDTVIIKSSSHMEINFNGNTISLPSGAANLQATSTGAAYLINNGKNFNYSDVSVYTCIDTNNNVQLCP